MYNAYSSGELIYLRYPTTDDVEGPWHEWFSDEDLTRWLGRNFPNNKENQYSFFETINKGPFPDRLVLSIIDKATDTHIGVCNLSSINWVDRNCDIAIVIGNKKYQTGPYLTEAFSLLIRIAFLRLNLRIIKSFFSRENSSSDVLHKLFNFEEVGCIPKSSYDSKKGIYVDQVICILNRDKWIIKNNL